jgi:hypothetical protein
MEAILQFKSRFMNNFGASSLGHCIWFDKYWQEPAVTEFSAFKTVCSLEPPDNSLFIYIAYPWATYIDLLRKRQTSGKNFFELQCALESIKEYLDRAVDPRKIIVTTCQHIHMIDHIDNFKSLGITNIFWSHKTRAVSKVANILLHPFPLFPVINESFDIFSEVNPKIVSDFLRRPFLCSFVGASAHPGYPNNLRKRICQELEVQEDTFIKPRDAWHFQEEVYKKQITSDPSKTSFRDLSNEEEYRFALRKSMFSFCPAGTGPNSIRLWESITFFSIPIVMSDTLDLGMNTDLFRSACLFYDESSDVSSIYFDLKSYSNNIDWIRQKLESLNQLRFLYAKSDISHELVSFLLNPYHRKNHTRSWSGADAINTWTNFGRLAKSLKNMRGIDLVFEREKANRTPFGYPQLYPYARNSIRALEKICQFPHIFISGMASNNQITAFSESDCSMFYHLSEEPLWDILYSNSDKMRNYEYSGFLTNVFNDLTIPYFLCTDSKYIERYILSYRRVLQQFNPESLLEHWNSLKIRFAAVCENRLDNKWDLRSSDKFNGFETLCVKRSLLCREMLHIYPGATYIKGRGWGKATNYRQLLPDWHLDKLANTPRSFTLCAIENVSAPSYVTEKPFDALALTALPIVYWPKDHSGKSLFKEGAYINLFGHPPSQWPERIVSFSATVDNAKSYLETTKYLYQLFSNTLNLHFSRKSLFSNIQNDVTRFSLQ